MDERPYPLIIMLLVTFGRVRLVSLVLVRLVSLGLAAFVIPVMFTRGMLLTSSGSGGNVLGSGLGFGRCPLGSGLSRLGDGRYRGSRLGLLRAGLLAGLLAGRFGSSGSRAEEEGIAEGVEGPIVRVVRECGRLFRSRATVEVSLRAGALGHERGVNGGDKKEKGNEAGSEDSHDGCDGG